MILYVVNSFELIPYLFTIPNVTSFLSERISQDPLEKFFGCQRMRGGVNDNPNVSQFLKNNQALRNINLDLVLGNCRGTNKKSLVLTADEEGPLKKRRRPKYKRYWFIYISYSIVLYSFFKGKTSVPINQRILLYVMPIQSHLGLSNMHVIMIRNNYIKL